MTKLIECIPNISEGRNMELVEQALQQVRSVPGVTLLDHSSDPNHNRSVITLSKEQYRFDIIFLDPPYDLLNYANPLKVVYKRGILDPAGIMVLERPTHIQFDGRYFDRFRVVTQGRKCLDFYRCRPAGQPGDDDDSKPEDPPDEAV